MTLLREPTGTESFPDDNIAMPKSSTTFEESLHHVAETKIINGGRSVNEETSYEASLGGDTSSDPRSSTPPELTKFSIDFGTSNVPPRLFDFKLPVETRLSAWNAERCSIGNNMREDSNAKYVFSVGNPLSFPSDPALHKSLDTLPSSNTLQADPITLSTPFPQVASIPPPPPPVVSREIPSAVPALSRSPRIGLPRIRKKVPWKGKNIMVLLPWNEKWGTRDEAPAPMSEEDVNAVLKWWGRMGYDTAGFDLDPSHKIDDEDGSQSRSPWPQPADMDDERQHRPFKIRIPPALQPNTPLAQIITQHYQIYQTKNHFHISTWTSYLDFLI
jgi:hypothetical protein